MASYTRHQLLVLLAALLVAGGGLAIAHWRRAHPDIVERIERFDRAPADAAAEGQASGTDGSREGSMRPATTGRTDAPSPGAASVTERADLGRPRARSPMDGRDTGSGGRGDDVPRRSAKLRADAGAMAGAGVDINRAPAEALARLPGVGPQLAARIVAAREAGPFTSPDDLRRVRGLGLAKLERLRPFVLVSAP